MLPGEGVLLLVAARLVKTQARDWRAQTGRASVVSKRSEGSMPLRDVVDKEKNETYGGSTSVCQLVASKMQRFTEQ